jgi:hypothetical protein
MARLCSSVSSLLTAAATVLIAISLTLSGRSAFADPPLSPINTCATCYDSECSLAQVGPGCSSGHCYYDGAERPCGCSCKDYSEYPYYDPSCACQTD